MKTFLLNRVEKIVSKGVIARFKQFLLLSQSFQKSSAAVQRHDRKYLHEGEG